MISLCVYRWPLIIDSNQQAATFLRYRDTNYLNVCSPKNMETGTIRMALLGAIRYISELASTLHVGQSATIFKGKTIDYYYNVVRSAV